MAVATDAIKATWPPPNYNNPVNLDGLVIGCTVPVLALSIIFLGIRFYGRGVLRHVLGADDWIMLAAASFAIPVSIFPLVSLNLGLGLHAWDQKPAWYTPYWKLGYTADLLFPAACSLTKISLCLTYLRLFPGQSDKVFCYAMSIFVTLYTVACLFLSLFQCRPIRAYWDPSVTPVCIDMRATLIAIAALNSFSDFLVYLWPAKPLWSLHLPVKQRLGLIFLFSVGLLVCVAGVLRMYYLERFFESYDTLWNGVPVWLCMVLELDIGIICGCLSGVKPVMATIFPSLLETSHRTRSGPTMPTYDQRTGRSTHKESFAFKHIHSSKMRNQHIENTNADDLPKLDDQGQRNFAWASSNGDIDGRAKLPANTITIDQEVMVEEEHSGSVTPTSRRHNELSDAGSEEWIFDGDGRKI